MPILLFLLCGFEFKAAENNIYDYAWLRISKVGENVLLCFGREEALVLCDPIGTPIKIYRQKGVGPNELKSPHILGIKKDRILIESNKNIIAFDRNLNLVKDSYPRLTTSISGGIYLGNSRFMTLIITQLKHAWLWRIEEGGAKAECLKKWLPAFDGLDQKQIPRLNDKYKSVLSNSTFLYGKQSIEADHVDISQFTYDTKRSSWEQINFLTQNVSHLPFSIDPLGSRRRGYWTAGGTNDQGFYILLTTYTEKKRSSENLLMWAHIYNQEPTLIQRFQLVGPSYPMFSFNSPDIFWLNPEKGTVTKVTLEELDDAASRQVTQ